MSRDRAAVAPRPAAAAVRMCYYFDQQKELIATKSPLTYFIPKPAMEVWNRAKERYGEIVAQDGVHPNEEGYKVFAGLFSEIEAFSQVHGAVLPRLARG